MAQLFISASGKMLGRWSQAFPEATVVCDVAASGGIVDRDITSVWLDLASLAPAQQREQVVAACAMTKPVVAMVAVPAEAEAFALLNTGVQGYCHIKAVPAQLREIALVVENKGLWMPPALMQRFLALSTRVMPAEASQEQELNNLTARELMVAEQVARGASNREIAVALAITERTVKAHLSVIFEKLAVRDRVHLALRMNNIPTYSTVN